MRKAAFCVGVCGGTGSGKSWLSRFLQDKLGARCTVLCQDWYYRENAHLSPEDARLLNFDHPEAIDMELFLRDADALRAGQAVDAPVYDYVLHGRTGIRRVEPAPVVVLEGLFVLGDRAIRRRLDLSVFIDVPDDLRLLRRIRRDCQERRVDLGETLRIYESSVMPMHGRFVAPSARHATWVWRQGQDGGLPARLLAEVSSRVGGRPLRCGKRRPLGEQRDGKIGRGEGVLEPEASPRRVVEHAQ